MDKHTHSGIKPAVGLVVVSSPLEVGANRADDVLEKAAIMIRSMGINIIDAVTVDTPQKARNTGKNLRNCDVLIAVAATWCEDYLVQDILAEIGSPTPVIAWGLPGLHTGSLCGTHQLCSVLKEIGVDYKFVYGELDNPQILKTVSAYAKACTARKKLKSSRIGRIGSRTAGMTEVTLDELELRSLFGVRLVERGIEWLNKHAENVDTEAAQQIWQQTKGFVGKINVSEDTGIESMCYYLALHKFIDEEELSGFTVQCYPDLMGKVCLPISMLAEEDIPGACEGDVNSALAMLLLSWFASKPVHNTDLLADDPENNTAIFSHCGSGAFCLAPSKDEIELNCCRLMDIGVTVQYTGRPGPVTLLNLIGRRGSYRIGIVTGEAVPTDMVFPGNPVKVRLDVQVDKFIYDTADKGLGHHWMICEGDVSEELRYLASLTGIPVHFPGLD